MYLKGRYFWSKRTEEGINQAIKYFANKLLASDGVKSTNEKNRERYKNKLGGEVIQLSLKLNDEEYIPLLTAPGAQEPGFRAVCEAYPPEM